AMYGTLALLEPDDQALVCAWVVNKFRGDVDLLRPGLEVLEQRTGRPVAGVVPWVDGVWLDGEDALAVAGWRGEHAPGVGGTVRVAVVRFPRISNATDVDALALEPGVVVEVTADPDVVLASDLVVLPGSRATVADLAWLRSTGLAQAVAARASDGRPVLGICGGHQMLAETIVDDVESGAGTVPGLGLLPTEVRFAAEKVLGRPTGAWRGEEVTAYEIHHGTVRLRPGAAAEPFLDGWRAGAVWGTTWHGAFESDGFRRRWLEEVARQAGSAWRPTAGPGFGAVRDAMIDRLADAVEEHLDTALLWRLVEQGVPDGLRVVAAG
ncbi:MAG TPA: cobyric acid synthase, partial [Angustibacter sp.]|nr:cobyric acid synthase [Angustibacter sp.]